MSTLSAALFTRVQAAPFYAAFHAEAAARLPDGAGRHWLDIGCGPGLLGRLVAARGYEVSGFDLDPAMVAAARRRAPAGRSISYAQGDLAGLVAAGTTAEVVSASSLLVVLPDPAMGLWQLLSLVRPGGTLLLLEASERMSFRAACRYWWRQRRRGSDWPLLLWALVRRKRTLAPAIFREGPHRVDATLTLVDGMVTAWYLSPARGQSRRTHPVIA